MVIISTSAVDVSIHAVSPELMSVNLTSCGSVGAGAAAGAAAVPAVAAASPVAAAAGAAGASSATAGEGAMLAVAHNKVTSTAAMKPALAFLYFSRCLLMRICVRLPGLNA